MNKIIYSVIALISISAGSIGFHLMNQSEELPLPEYALHYKDPRILSDFSLTDELGDPFTNEQLIDKWSFIFLGYTSCPDVCPMTLQNLNFIYDELTTIASNSQVLLVSADPKRDSTNKLSQYIAYFNPHFKALRGEHDVLFPFTRNLGLMYAITSKPNEELTKGESEEENYWVDHSASLVLINPAGNIEAIFKTEQEIGGVPTINNDKLLSDYQKIVALYQ